MATMFSPEPSTQQTSPSILVVAAVIERRGRYLLARRPPDKAHGGLWEFPGGKVGVSESPAVALARELHEELALENVRVHAELRALRDTAAGLELRFHAVETRAAPIALEHSALGWYRPADLSALALAPLDRSFAQRFFTPP